MFLEKQNTKTKNAKNTIKPTQVLRDYFQSSPDLFGNYIFTDFVHKVFSITHYAMSNLEIVKLAGYCITFVAVWYRIVKALEEAEKEIQVVYSIIFDYIYSYLLL